MDRDAEHPHGKSLNPINAFGYTVAAFKAQQGQIEELQTENTELRSLVERMEARLTALEN